MIKKRLLIFAAALGLIGLLLLPAPAFAADVLNPACDDGLVDPETGDVPAACRTNTDQQSDGNDLYGPKGLLTRIAGLVARVVGIAAVIMIIIAGFKYVQSSGDPNNIKSAKDTIMYAVIGILVAITAQSLVVFVLSKL